MGLGELAHELLLVGFARSLLAHLTALHDAFALLAKTRPRAAANYRARMPRRLTIRRDGVDTQLEVSTLERMHASLFAAFDPVRFDEVLLPEQVAAMFRGRSSHHAQVITAACSTT